MMKRIALLAALFFAAATHAQVVQTVANNAPSVALTPKAAGNTLLVQCDYNAAGAPTGSIIDSEGTAFTAVAAPNVGQGIVQLVALSAPLLTAAADRPACPAGAGFGEIYVVEMAGSNALDGPAVQATGATTPARATVPSNPGDILVAFVVTGTATNAAGWTAASQFDGNLVAYIIPPAASLLASFKTTAPWAITVLAIQHVATAPAQPYQLTIGGLATFLFPLTNFSQVPACTSADGACSLQLEICDLSMPPVCSVMTAGKVYILKNVSTPASATQQTLILAVTSP